MRIKQYYTVLHPDQVTGELIFESPLILRSLINHAL